MSLKSGDIPFRTFRVQMVLQQATKCLCADLMKLKLIISSYKMAKLRSHSDGVEVLKYK